MSVEFSVTFYSSTLHIYYLLQNCIIKNFSFSIFLITYRALNLLLKVQAQHLSSIVALLSTKFNYPFTSNRFGFMPLWLYRSGMCLVIYPVPKIAIEECFLRLFHIRWPCKHYNFRTCLRDNLVSRMLEVAFQSLQISKFSGGACPQTPLG